MTLAHDFTAASTAFDRLRPSLGVEQANEVLAYKTQAERGDWNGVFPNDVPHDLKAEIWAWGRLQGVDTETAQRAFVDHVAALQKQRH
ncbi:uncharacterized protein LOC62_02G002074 [Vanrija pseudolonga]|uniref:ACB domain-containing protein n=1 Tax=Vanrija pseudolonga TaxID=143232 RepID=A0AAF0Y348_9TREE|nr:hypothetical protein LOC62_02G002074 [Vanrija pseudolonga]